MFYGTISLNGGVSFQANSNLTSDTTNGYEATLAGNLNFGDYTGLTYYGGTFWPVWADNSGGKGANPDGPTNTFDIVEAPVVLKGLADVSITSQLVISTNLPQIGSLLYYYLTVSNAGPSAVTGASVTDVFPSEVYVRAAFPTNGSTSQSYTVHGGTLTWPVGSLAPGDAATILVETTAVNIGSASNYAAISPGAGVVDLLTNDNTSTLVTTIYGANLNVSITPTPSVIGYGAPLVTFTVTVSNQGPVGGTGCHFQRAFGQPCLDSRVLSAPVHLHHQSLLRHRHVQHRGHGRRPVGDRQPDGLRAALPVFRWFRPGHLPVLRAGGNQPRQHQRHRRGGGFYLAAGSGHRHDRHPRGHDGGGYGDLCVEPDKFGAGARFRGDGEQLPAVQPPICGRERAQRLLLYQSQHQREWPNHPLRS